MTQSGHSILSRLMSLLGVKRTCLVALHESAFDPKRTSTTSHGLPKKTPAGASGIKRASRQLGLFKEEQFWALQRGSLHFQ
jgi:hypothetical protein